MRYLIIAILLFCTIAVGEDVAIVSNPIGKGMAHVVVSAVDIAVLDSTDNLSPEIDFTQSLRPTATFSASFSNASATSKAIFMRYDKKDGNPVWPSATSNTFTASATDKWNGRFISDSWAPTTAGRRYGRIFVRSISAGDVDVNWSAH